MRIAMGTLAVLAVIAGVLYLPFGITEWLPDFLEPTFADSIVQHPANDGLEAFGLILTSVIAVVFMAVAYRIWAVGSGRATAWQERFPALHRLFVNKWYFDELIGLVIVRPAAWSRALGA